MTQPVQELAFKEKIFNIGKNVTIRRGVKWASEREAFIHGVGKVKLKTKVIPFGSLTEDDLKFEHSPSCRTFDGIIEAMNTAYPDFDTREVVTIVEFEVARKK